MENNNNIQFDNLVDTDAAELETTESTITSTEESTVLSNFGDVENEMDLTSEKLNELNKKLPSWSLEPPHNFVK